MKTYSLSPQQFSALRTRLLELGVTLPDGNQGNISYQGIVLSYAYDGTGTLALDVVKKPMFVPASLIWEKVDQWVTA